MRAIPVRLLILSTLVIGLSCVSFGSGRENQLTFQSKFRDRFVCGEKKQANGLVLKYCYLSPTKSQPLVSMRSIVGGKYRLVYYFHGAGLQNLEILFREMLRFSEDVHEKHGKLILPIAVTYGPHWFLSDEPSKYDTELLVTKHFSAIRSEIEAKEKIHTEEKFSLIGTSMGGNNALRIYLKYPNKVGPTIVYCPGIVSLSPFANDEDKLAYNSITGATPEIMEKMQQILVGSYVDDTHFRRENLFQTARSTGNTKLPPLFFSFENKDEFGFAPEASYFLPLITTRINHFEIYQLPGGHCTTGTKLLSRSSAFIAN